MIDFELNKEPFNQTRMSAPAATTSAAKPTKSKEKEQQEIVAQFQRLREEQKAIASKAAELQIEQKSHEYDWVFFTFLIRLLGRRTKSSNKISSRIIDRFKLSL